MWASQLWKQYDPINGIIFPGASLRPTYNDKGEEGRGSRQLPGARPLEEEGVAGVTARPTLFTFDSSTQDSERSLPLPKVSAPCRHSLINRRSVFFIFIFNKTHHPTGVLYFQRRYIFNVGGM